MLRTLKWPKGRRYTVKHVVVQVFKSCWRAGIDFGLRCPTTCETMLKHVLDRCGKRKIKANVQAAKSTLHNVFRDLLAMNGRLRLTAP